MSIEQEEAINMNEASTSMISNKKKQRKQTRVTEDEIVMANKCITNLVEEKKCSKDIQTHTYFKDGPTALCLSDQDVVSLKKALWINYMSGNITYNTFTEKIRKDDIIKFFVDIDFKLEWFQVKTPEGIHNTMTTINKMVVEEVQSVTDSTEECIITNRLEYKEHLFFPNLIMTKVAACKLVNVLTERLSPKIKALVNVPDDEPVIDKGVYNVGLRMLYCHKGFMWKKHKLKAEQDAHSKVYGKGTWVDYYKVVDPLTLKAVVPTMEHLDLTQITTMEPVTYTDEFEDVLSTTGNKKSNKSQVLISTKDWTDVAHYLEQKGGRKQVRYIGKTDMGFNYDCNRSEPCFCNGHHTSNNWYVIVLPTCMLTGNYSPNCHTHKIDINEQKFDDFMTMITEENEYAVMFAETMKDKIKYTGDSKRGFMTCEKGYWETLNKTKLQCMLKDMFKPMLDKLQSYCLWNFMYYERLAGERALTDDEVKAKKQSKVHKEQALKGRKYIRSQRNTTQLVEACKETLLDCDLVDKLDKRNDLFAFTNKVCDLETLEMRDFDPDDMISRTTGYDYDDHIDPRTQDEFLEFIKQIYPVDDEREFIQTYFGYCLRGDHPEKILLFLTDTRDGYNGKSTVGKLLRKTWGNYAMSGNKELLYKRDKNFETENSHQSGKLLYDKIRVVSFEELDEERRLNNELIKEYNGSNYSLPVRQANSSETKEMPWSAKMVMMFNGMKLPKFDIDDKALINRPVTIQHRSKFVATQADLEQERELGHEYTYLADTHLDDKLEKWTSYFFRWCLEGLKLYQQHRFTKKPKACQQWQQELVQTQNVVQEFINRFVSKSENPKLFVKQAHLWDKYSNEYRDIERNNKTKIGKHKFIQRLTQILPMNAFKTTYRFENDVKKNVWVGFILIQDEPDDDDE